MNRLNLPLLLLFIMIILLFSLIFGILFLWPKYSEFKTFSQDVRIKEEEAKQKEEYFSKLWQIKDELKNYTPELAKINSSLPQDSNLPDLLNFLQGIGSQSGLVLKEVTPFVFSVSKEKPALKEAEFNLILEGPYPSLKNFLLALEKSARLIEIEKISFSSPTKGELFTFNLKIKVYSY